MLKPFFVLVIGLIAIPLIGYGFQEFITNRQVVRAITTFEECVDAGNPVMESYPPQCQADGNTFVQEIENQERKPDIIVNNPKEGELILSPLIITGEAHGTWFFEGVLPIRLVNSAGVIIVQTTAQAQGEWMTEEFVPFSTTLEFQATDTSGSLIIEKSNPSGLPENDDELVIPVAFSN